MIRVAEMKMTQFLPMKLYPYTVCHYFSDKEQIFMHTDIKMSEKETAVPTYLPDTMSEPRPEQKGPKVYRLVGSVKSALFILSTGLLFFAAARNSFHW